MKCPCCPAAVYPSSYALANQRPERHGVTNSNYYKRDTGVNSGEGKVIVGTSRNVKADLLGELSNSVWWDNKKPVVFSCEPLKFVGAESFCVVGTSVGVRACSRDSANRSLPKVFYKDTPILGEIAKSLQRVY